MTPYASESFLHQLLGKALAANASDIHLKVGQPPGARVRGDMVYFRVDKMSPEDTDAVARIILAERVNHPTLETLNEYDTSYSVSGLGRFRVNIYRQRGTLGDRHAQSIPRRSRPSTSSGARRRCAFSASTIAGWCSSSAPRVTARARRSPR